MKFVWTVCLVIVGCMFGVLSADAHTNNSFQEPANEKAISAQPSRWKLNADIWVSSEIPINIKEAALEINQGRASALKCGVTNNASEKIESVTVAFCIFDPVSKKFAGLTAVRLVGDVAAGNHKQLDFEVAAVARAAGDKNLQVIKPGCKVFLMPTRVTWASGSSWQLDEMRMVDAIERYSKSL